LILQSKVYIENYNNITEYRETLDTESKILMKELISELREFNDNFSRESRRTELAQAKMREKRILDESLKRQCK
tara:strand:- start:348 stop:569 length:222 start_codon:yes stop_codon:yes gene_type:complete